jgi:hypothetical protein
MTEQRRPPPPRRGRPIEPPYGFGRPPLPRRTYHSRYAPRMDDGATGAGGRLAGLLLALAVAALILTHGLWQVTAPVPAGRILRAILPPLTDLDQTLTANRESIRELAAGQPEDGAVVVPGLPIHVEIPRGLALTAEPAALRMAVLTRMSDTLYREGAIAFRAPDAAAPEPPILSSQWALQSTLDLLTAQRHQSLRTPRLAALILTLALAALTIVLHEGPARLLGPGAALIAGALIAAFLALAWWALAFLFFGGEDVVDDIVRRVARDSAVTVALVAAAFAVFGLLVTLLGLLARRLDQIEPPAPAPAPPPVNGRDRRE